MGFNRCSDLSFFVLFVSVFCLDGVYGSGEDGGNSNTTNIIIGACVSLCVVGIVWAYCRTHCKRQYKTEEEPHEVHVIQVTPFKNPNAKAAECWDETPMSAEDIYKESEESAKAHGKKTKEAQEKNKSRLEARLAARKQKG